MERKRISQSLVPIVNDFLRVGMWSITEPYSKYKDPVSGIVKTIYNYGEGKSAGKVIVWGELKEEDRGAFFIISAMDKNVDFQGITGHITDLVKMKGSKNPYQVTEIDPMWDSVERLLDVNIRIKPNVRGGSTSAGFRLVSGTLDSGGNFYLTTADYHNMVKHLNLHEHNIYLPNYFIYKSPIARSLKVFLESQQPFYFNSGYQISLKKLCNYIGYSIRNRPMWRVWQYFENAMKELKETEFLSQKCKRNKDVNKSEGGIVEFYSGKKELRDKAKESEEIMKQITGICPCGWIFGESYSGSKQGCMECEDDNHKEWKKCRLYHQQYQKSKKN